MTFSEVMLKAGIDLETTLRRFSGNEALMERFMRRFPQDATFGSLKCAIDERNWDEACRAAHTLKGIAGNLGLDHLMELCADLVAAQRQGSDEDVPAHYSAIAGEYTRLIDLLAQLDPPY